MAQSRIDRYLAGETVREIANADGVIPYAAYQTLVHNDIPIRNGREKQPLSRKMKTRIRRYESGQSIHAIAKQEGIVHNTIYRFLKKNKIKIRGRQTLHQEKPKPQSRTEKQK